MNEQEMILRKKIEKRERFDTILAYILMVILLGCIVFILYLKFIKKEEVVQEPEEYVPNYISLNEISNSLNTSTLANRYMNDNASFGSNVSGNSMSVVYTKEDINVNLNVPLVGNELMITMDNSNTEIVTDIYKEIANTICMYYGNEEKYCRNTLDNITSDGVDGIRFVNSGDTNTVYIGITKSYTVNTEIVYNSVNEVNIDETDYVLNINDVKVYNISVVTSDTNITFSGSVERLTDDTSNINVVVKLYDVDGNVLGENKYEYNDENVLEGTGTFEVSFILSDTLKLEDIARYSIDIVK